MKKKECEEEKYHTESKEKRPLERGRTSRTIGEEFALPLPVLAAVVRSYVVTQMFKGHACVE